MRFYLYRTDSDSSGKDKYKNQVVAQVVMPVEGFVGSVVFLERVLHNWVKNGTIKKELVDHYTALLDKASPK